MAQLTLPGGNSEVALDSCPIINGVENANPPTEIAQTRAMAFTNRLAVIDNRNRARPGITRQINAAAVPIVVASYFGSGIYLLSDGTNLWSYSTLTKVQTLLTTGLPFVAGPGTAAINACPGGNPGTNAALFMN